MTQGRRPSRFVSALRKSVRVLWFALRKYSEIDGELRAASFAYYAFFAMFPLLLLFISVGAMFVDRTAVQQEIVAFVNAYAPVAADLVNSTIGSVLNTRGSAGAIALLVLAWSALRFFQALVHGVNHAWHTHEIPWWKMPVKNLAMVGIVASALLLGIIIPVIVKYIEWYYWRLGLSYGASEMVLAFKMLEWVVPPAVLFYGFSMFYKFAPYPRKTFLETWLASVTVTLALLLVRDLFVLYVKNFAHFNKLYGTLGGVVGLLMWIYLSGSIIIFGGCLSAAQAEVEDQMAKGSGSNEHPA